ncbi:RICIN domain-containing protein [Streptomyces sp. bgisy082]|uniref:RICIN domain-containing protein n=1 Tax=Streptomyces sp. bgisy082 TaxID=3413776 RepID=UPI003D70E36A
MGAHGVSERAGVMGDRWGNSMGGTVQDSQYVWLPLKFPTKITITMTMDCSPKVTIDTATGKVTGMNVVRETLSVRSRGKCLDVTDYSYADGAALDRWTCNGGRNQQWERTIA